MTGLRVRPGETHEPETGPNETILVAGDAKAKSGAITAILPIHNEARVLRRVLDNIDEQTRRPDEVILVFDKCTDESEAIGGPRADQAISISAGNTAAAVRAGLARASQSVFILFDGNTLVPRNYVERMAEAWEVSRADVIEWHGGLILLTRATLEKFGPPSDRYLWTLEYFLRIREMGGTVLVLDGPFDRLKTSPLQRNLRYGLDYSDLSTQYDLPPFFAIGRKSGFAQDVAATIGAAFGYARRGALIRALLGVPMSFRAHFSRSLRNKKEPRRRDVRIRIHPLYTWRLERSVLRKEFHSRIANQAAALHSGGWILDVGCGPGLLGRDLSRRLPEARLVCVDLDEWMLRECRSRVTCDAVRATSEKLPFRNDQIGLVVSSASLKDWGEPELGLAEISRVLKAGCAALVFEFITLGPGAEPKDFRHRFGLASELARRAMRFAAPFTFEMADRLARHGREGATTTIAVFQDIGVVGITIRKHFQSPRET